MALFDVYLARFFRRETFLESVTYLPQHVLLWALLVSEIRYIRKHSFGKSCRHTKDLLLLFAKSVLNLVVLVLAISNFGRPATPLATRIIEALSYIITLTLLHLGEHYNVRDQTFLLCFWTLDLLINSIRMVEQSSIESMVFGGIMLTLVLLIAYSSVISSCHSNSTVPPNLIRSVFFSWFNDINRAIHRSTDELGTLNDDMQAATLMRSFRGVTVSRGQYESVAIGEEASPTLISIRSMLRPFLRDLITTGVNRLVLTVLFFVCPFLLGQILRQDRSTELETHSQVISIFIVSLLIAALNGQYLYDAQKIGLKIKSALMTMVYEKSLKLTSSNPADVTLLTLDSSRFIDLLPNVHMIWSGPLIIVASIVGW
uniref:ABC transporter C family member 14 n=1 Tax=Culex pipiens TaxID=7175 RepID=A0A8D8EVB9_CULPI